MLNFHELIATSETAIINGGGVLYPNKAFIDLSASRVTAVNRTSWDLGFYTGSDDFRVILNSSSAMMAKQINKNDLNAVTAADTVGLTNEVAFSLFTPTTISLPYIDYPNGDLTRTAITQISATAADNKVYIVNRGLGVGSPAPARGWKKVRIIRNSSGGYTLQYADIAATSFTSVDIPKDDAYFFKYVSFDNGSVSAEPEKKKWDLAWTYFSNVTNFGADEVPYLFQDIILLNRNVRSAKVMTSAIPFVTFDSIHIAAQTFSSAQTAIAADWRSGGGPTTSPAVRTDRYYIIKDGSNNYYKLRFTALTQNGERGYPAYEAILIKKG
ncbi:MAG: HmuY family protein [Chitinophagaceae bacterium]|nr:HmuY family protein [Chitinophagaceae bacterium]